MSTVQMDQALADQMVETAVAHCADRAFGGDRQQALLSLHQGRCDICKQLSTELVKQVGEYLGRMDRTVKVENSYFYRIVVCDDSGFCSEPSNIAAVLKKQPGEVKAK